MCPTTGYQELDRDPHKDTFAYYKNIVSESINKGINIDEREREREREREKFKDQITQINEYLNKIKIGDEPSAYYFLVIAAACLKLRETFNKSTSPLYSLKQSFFGFLNKNSGKTNTGIDNDNTRSINQALRMLKAAIFKFIERPLIKKSLIHLIQRHRK